MFKIFQVSMENFEKNLSQSFDSRFLSPLPFSLLSLSPSLTLPPLRAHRHLSAPARALLRRCPHARCPVLSARLHAAPLTFPPPSRRSLRPSAPSTSAPQATNTRLRVATPPWHPTCRPCTCQAADRGRPSMPHATGPQTSSLFSLGSR